MKAPLYGRQTDIDKGSVEGARRRAQHYDACGLSNPPQIFRGEKVRYKLVNLVDLAKRRLAAMRPEAVA